MGVFGAAIPSPAGAVETGTEPATGDDNRRYWVSLMDKIARPVLENLARRELKKSMPVEAQPGANRGGVTHLEAFGRLLSGMAPWLAAENLTGGELSSQRQFCNWRKLHSTRPPIPRRPIL